jgi:two-component system response regulator LytT
MRILLIEDEIKTAQALARLITAIKPDATILSAIQSVQTAISYLLANPAPDLIFMDVQLADGLCLEIFKEVAVTSPVVFCTAYDEYALEAFKTNGVAYILKPFSKESIEAAFAKIEQLEQAFKTEGASADSIAALVKKLGASKYKTSFLVFMANKYVTIDTNSIAYFYIRNETPTLVTLEQQEYPLAQSLDEVSQQLDPQQFFRINRQYLVSFLAVKEVEHYFARKLWVKLAVATTEKILVGKDKTTAFLTWLDKR